MDICVIAGSLVVVVLIFFIGKFALFSQKSSGDDDRRDPGPPR